MPRPKPHISQVTDWPVYWFARLALAVEDGDHPDAAKAHFELLRLGVEVRFPRRAVRNRATSNRAI